MIGHVIEAWNGIRIRFSSATMATRHKFLLFMAKAKSIVNKKLGHFQSTTATRWRRVTPAIAVAFTVTGVTIGLTVWVQSLVGGPAGVGATTTKALMAFDALTDNQQTVDAYGKLMTPIGWLMAAPIGLLGVMLAFWRTYNQHRDSLLSARKLDAESFAKAVEHLGSDKSSIRMGAALALEDLAKASPRLLSQAVEILCASVREARPVAFLIKNSEETEINKDTTSAIEPQSHPPVDISLILTIIIRLKGLQQSKHISLRFDRTNLSGFTLSRADLSKAELSKANLSRANLSRANLSRALMYQANLDEASLSEANLKLAFLRSANLTGAYLFRADLTGANLLNAKLSRAELNRANLSKATLSAANLTGAHLIEANLEGAKLDGANLIGANLDETNLIGANLEGAKLDGANLIGANLDGAYLDGAYLDGAYLDGANLTEANLIGASLTGASLTGAKLDGANLDGAYLDGANLTGASLTGANLTGANLTGANLTGANLTGAKLDGANLDGANLDGAHLHGVLLTVRRNEREPV
ncbi:pentapeptide repeat-containing protein [Azospirillum argentinense]